ncbi:MAG: hypothetical protein KGH55_01705 [Nanoarchaeota archaeon]|nr:hypothetical protein [Nanoarchaeota archaeon]
MGLYDYEEVMDSLINYDHFRTAKESFQGDKTEVNAKALMYWIQNVRRLPNSRIRAYLPYSMGVDDHALGLLEEECKKVLIPIAKLTIQIVHNI